MRLSILVTLCALINVNYGDYPANFEETEVSGDIEIMAIQQVAADSAGQDEEDDSRYDNESNRNYYDVDEYHDNDDDDARDGEHDDVDDYNDDDSTEDQLHEKVLDEKEAQSVAEKMVKAFGKEVKAGDAADLFTSNRHQYVPGHYDDLSRRFILQYPYKEVDPEDRKGRAKEIVPIKAPPEVVLALAKESVRIGNMKPVQEFEEKDILRSGNYWNAVWKDDSKPGDILRTRSKGKNPTVNTVRAKFLPGSSLYELIAQLKDVSPQLLYIIHKKPK